MRQALEDVVSRRGEGWYYNPPRWRTHDGYVDYHSFIATLAAERRHRAQVRLEAAAAHRLGMGGEQVAALLKATEREAEGNG